MERLQERLELARKTLSTLNEVITIHTPNAIERDATIQRFEYSFEAVWKAVKRHLNLVEGIDVSSSKAVIRASLEVGLLDETTCRQALAMVDDRNLTSHTYNEKLADEILERIPLHAQVMNKWVAAMGKVNL